MPQLVLGPLLRYVSETEATVWVETDARCEVAVLDHTARTFEVEGHHYALVRVAGLSPGSDTEYEVALDGERAWPPAEHDFPPSLIRTLDPDRPLRISFGSCRVAYPQRPPYSLPKDEDPQGREVDALYALARRMRTEPPDTWPDLLLLLGDQVYADEASPKVREFIASRRDPDEPPGYEVANFEEYVHLYYETWGDTDPSLRWLLSTVSTAMIWDDHDVHDDWNTSDVWLAEMRAKPWWKERISSAVMSYWLYQHIGNLEPHHLDEDEMFDRVLRCDGDAGPLLREWSHTVAHEVEGARWSYVRDLCSSRLVMMDSRGGRVLDPDKRSMLDNDEWACVDRWASERECDHLLLGTSLPWLLSPAMHYLEAWDEAVCGGAYGSQAAKLGEKLRQGLDLEHWAAFERSFEHLEKLVQRVGSAKNGVRPPATIVALSGDVHHAYLMEAGFRREANVESAVYQAVCSPFRNPLDRHERAAIKLMASRGAAAVTRALAKTAGVREPDMRWRLAGGREPWFDNQVGTLELDGRRARLIVEKTRPNEHDDPSLNTALEAWLAD
ncbi:MAG TPA: alkaline phosphatase D family protein [Thermoleophilaceae bacterium]